MKEQNALTWFNRAELSIAQGAVTNSKRPEAFVKKVYPTHLSRGEGCYVYSDTNRQYIDYICGLGSNLLGYAHPQINAAFMEAINQGSCLSLSSTIEVELAEKIKELCPFIDRIKFLKTGTEACNASIRIARAATGRKLGLSEGYHGWGNSFVSMSPPALGCVKDEFLRPFVSVDDISYDTAFVIIEPVNLDTSEERRSHLRAIRERCTATGTILIFDEIITGFRVPNFTISRMFGISPDVILLGKAMANGHAISVVGGTQAVMECAEYFVSGTFAGERGPMAASLKVIELLKSNKYRLDDLYATANYFCERFNKLDKAIKIEGYGTRGRFVADDMFKALFWQEAVKAGIMFGPSFFYNFRHTEHDDIVLSTCRDIIQRINLDEVKLEGDLPRSPFAERVRNESTRKITRIHESKSEGIGA